MAWHATPTLSFGSPPPSYPFIAGDELSPERAAALIAQRESVHVQTQEQAVLILTAIGLNDEWIAYRMKVAYADYTEAELRTGRVRVPRSPWREVSSAEGGRALLPAPQEGRGGDPP